MSRLYIHQPHHHHLSPGCTESLSNILRHFKGCHPLCLDADTFSDEEYHVHPVIPCLYQRSDCCLQYIRHIRMAFSFIGAYLTCHLKTNWTDWHNLLPFNLKWKNILKILSINRQQHMAINCNAAVWYSPKEESRSTVDSLRISLCKLSFKVWN